MSLSGQGPRWRRSASGRQVVFPRATRVSVPRASRRCSGQLAELAGRQFTASLSTATSWAAAGFCGALPRTGLGGKPRQPRGPRLGPAKAWGGWGGRPPFRLARSSADYLRGLGRTAGPGTGYSGAFYGHSVRLHAHADRISKPSSAGRLCRSTASSSSRQTDFRWFSLRRASRRWRGGARRWAGAARSCSAAVRPRILRALRAAHRDDRTSGIRPGDESSHVIRSTARWYRRHPHDGPA